MVPLGWATSSTALHLILIELNVSSHIEIIKAQSSFQELLSKQKFKIKNVEAFASSLILLKSIFCFVLFCFVALVVEIEGRKFFWPPASKWPGQPHSGQKKSSAAFEKKVELLE